MSVDPAGAATTALVTGATSGIGRALATSLAAAGATVGIVARDPVRGERTRTGIVAATGNERIGSFMGDLSDLASIRHSTSSSTARRPTPHAGP
jgi:NAD(P)-dependent dehydrogenase (short-subunit alcohol dehydrogenase family)